MKYWKIYCMEKQWPGLWRKFFQNQAVAVGFPPIRGNRYGKAWKLHDSAGDAKWSRIRNCFNKITPGDKIVVQLENHCIGRIGEIVKLKIDDNHWQPLVRPSKRLPIGEMGRQILVRWDLSDAPLDPDVIIRLPRRAQLTSGKIRATLCSISKAVFAKIENAMHDKVNWDDLLPHRFSKEWAISDYLGTYPHRLEDGLHPYPDMKVREKIFRDKTRADVLLEDTAGKAVIVECKQNTPTTQDIKQLRHYMAEVARITGEKTRGILVHGGTEVLPKEVKRNIHIKPSVEVVHYKYSVEFSV